MRGSQVLAARGSTPHSIPDDIALLENGKRGYRRTATGDFYFAVQMIGATQPESAKCPFRMSLRVRSWDRAL
jgi:hypothetical protein